MWVRACACTRFFTLFLVAREQQQREAIRSLWRRRRRRRCFRQRLCAPQNSKRVSEHVCARASFRIACELRTSRSEEASGRASERARERARARTPNYLCARTRGSSIKVKKNHMVFFFVWGVRLSFACFL